MPSHFCCSAMSSPAGRLFHSALHVCSPMHSPFVASHPVVGPFGSTSQTRMSMALYQPWPREPLASNPLVRLREPLLLSLRHWHAGRKAMPCLGWVCAQDITERKRVLASAAIRWKAQTRFAWTWVNVSLINWPDWLPREAAQGGEGTLEMPLRQHGHEHAAPL